MAGHLLFLAEILLPGSRWQFTGSGVLPGLSYVLAQLPMGVHPQAAEGFFTSEITELVAGGAALHSGAVARRGE